jgi:DNA-binding NarL/FixJ family response regulator
LPLERPSGVSVGRLAGLRGRFDAEAIDAGRLNRNYSGELDPAVRTIIREHLEAGDADGEVLTPREREVVKLVAEAHTTDQIAELLVISPRTVERHRENILNKLGMRDRVELTRYAIRRGLVEP